jgi:hypothetical protein
MGNITKCLIDLTNGKKPTNHILDPKNQSTFTCKSINTQKKKKKKKKKLQLHRSCQGDNVQLVHYIFAISFASKFNEKMFIKKGKSRSLTLKTYENVKIPSNKIFKENTSSSQSRIL